MEEVTSWIPAISGKFVLDLEMKCEIMILKSNYSNQFPGVGRHFVTVVNLLLSWGGGTVMLRVLLMDSCWMSEMKKAHSMWLNFRNFPKCFHSFLTHEIQFNIFFLPFFSFVHFNLIDCNISQLRVTWNSRRKVINSVLEGWNNKKGV